MSHFTVLVIGDDIDEQLAPFAEQGADEKYVEFQDMEDEYLDEYKNKEFDVLQLADGTVRSIYDKEYEYYDKNDFQRKYNYPEGSVQRKGRASEIYPTFEEFVADWHGNEERDEVKGRFGYWSNPNAKWDWYEVGGRWTGFFKPKAGAEGSLGRPGLMTERPTNGWVDQIRVGDVDFDGMREAAATEANETYDKLEAILQGRPLPSWKKVFDKHGKDNVKAAREEFNNMQVVKDLHAAKFFIMGDFEEVFGPNREEYVERCKNATARPYAMVKDSQWYQKGEMGWFGMSHDEVSEDEWNKKFWEMILSLPPETMLTLVDCHI